MKFDWSKDPTVDLTTEDLWRQCCINTLDYIERTLPVLR